MQRRLSMKLSGRSVKAQEMNSKDSPTMGQPRVPKGSCPWPWVWLWLVNDLLLDLDDDGDDDLRYRIKVEKKLAAAVRNKISNKLSIIINWLNSLILNCLSARTHGLFLCSLL